MRLSRTARDPFSRRFWRYPSYRNAETMTYLRSTISYGPDILRQTSDPYGTSYGLVTQRPLWRFERHIDERERTPFRLRAFIYKTQRLVNSTQRYATFLLSVFVHLRTYLLSLCGARYPGRPSVHRCSLVRCSVLLAARNQTCLHSSRTAPFVMARGSRKASAPSAWSAAFYLLLAFVAPLALLGTVGAQEDVNAQNDSYGTGPYMFHCRQDVTG